MAGDKMRVLPLGGLGEIGKNMTVIEYDGRLLVVDCGLRFPTARCRGSCASCAQRASCRRSSARR